MSRPGCAICGSDKARYEANHGPSGPFSVVPPEPHPGGIMTEKHDQLDAHVDALRDQAPDLENRSQ